MCRSGVSRSTHAVPKPHSLEFGLPPSSSLLSYGGSADLGRNASLAPEMTQMDPRPRTKGAETPLHAAVRRLDSTTNWESRPRVRMRPSLDPIRDLLRRLGSPSCPHVVHVAGSKGKGSVASLVAAGLRRAGLRVGRYASPHVERMNERVVLDGVEVSDAVLAAGLNAALDAREAASREGSAGAEGTWFDLVTAAALLIFAREQVPWVVAEVGLGGRLDSTNVLAGEVCVVTSIELEHTNVLGHTLTAIAREKAGIFHAHCTVVTGVAAAGEAGRALDARARELGLCPVRPLERPGAPGALETLEATNRALAGAVLGALGERDHRGAEGTHLGPYLLDDETCRAARLPGRGERFLCAGTPVVLDGAHTPGSVARILKDLRGAPGLPGRPVVVLALAAEKDLRGILKTLRGVADTLICTSVGGALHQAPGEIARVAAGVEMGAEIATSPTGALQQALRLAGGEGWVLILGSLYLAGALRPSLGPTQQDLSC